MCARTKSTSGGAGCNIRYFAMCSFAPAISPLASKILPSTYSALGRVYFRVQAHGLLHALLRPVQILQLIARDRLMKVDFRIQMLGI